KDCDNVSLSIAPGEIQALLGENGAGKSTLMKILYGVVRPDSGEIFLNGKPVDIQSPKDARDLGIGMVFQHFSLFETLTVAENILLALGKQAGDKSTLSTRIRVTSQRYGIPVNPDQRVANLSTGERQRAEIVRCLLQDIQLLILDEPTSVLTPQEVDTLMVTLNTLAEKGCSILFISHKLTEVKALCHKATILRAGKVTGICDPKHETTASLAALMVGESFSLRNVERHLCDQETLRVQQLSTQPLHPFDVPLKNLSFSLHAGEILGIAGIAGNGQEALLMALAGETPKNTQQIVYQGNPIDNLDANTRRRLGVAYVPGDRLNRAAISEKSLADNTLLTAFHQGLVKKGLIQRKKMNAMAASIIQQYQVKAQSVDAQAKSLSGGNLQKFILGREIEQKPKLLIAAHPTWGVDVGAQLIIHDALIKLRDQGCAIIIVSEDLDELFYLSDRLGAICHGQLSPIRPTDELTSTQVGCWMAGDFNATGQHEGNASKGASL
ncbi:MAG: ABC transporter ATP-binding protein, partial [Cellvibrionales bacterium]|nr:ABC transporter ATP-binding protein [Cellvibrionales bacterium]